MIVAGLMIASAAVQVYGQIKAGSDADKAAKANAEYYRKQAEFNKLVAKREEESFKSDLDKMQASTIAGAAASNIAMSGSVLSVMADNMAMGQAEIEDIRLRGRMAVDQSQYAASRSTAEGKAEKFKSYIGAGQSILSGYTDYKQGKAQGWIE